MNINNILGSLMGGGGGLGNLMGGGGLGNLIRGGQNNSGGGGYSNLGGTFSNMQNNNQAPPPNFSAQQNNQFSSGQNPQSDIPNYQNDGQNMQGSAPNFEGNFQNQQNFSGGQNNSQMLQSILPMLMGGGNANQNELFSNFAKNNPSMSGIMSLLPNLQSMQSQNPTRKREKKSPTSYVKVKDYYNN